jgi:DNA-binding transcriptional MerR regulator
MDDRVVFTVGELARRTGLPARTIRFWAEIGALPPAGRSASGYRLYDAAGLARLELIATLRQLGVGLADIRRVLDRRATLAEVAAAHVRALDAQIDGLRLRRGVLAEVARHGSAAEEMVLMQRFAKLSDQQRKRLVDDFLEETLGGLEAAPGVLGHLLQARPDLPESPTPEQLDAWMELAELVSDPGFRNGVRALAIYTTRQRQASGPQASQPPAAVRLARRVVTEAGAAQARGVAPDSPEAAQVLDRVLGGDKQDASQAELLDLLAQLEIVTDPRGERYWELVGVLHGWPPYPDGVPSLEHVRAGLRAHGWVIAALRAHA